MYVRFPLSLRNVEDLLLERSIDICHETVRHWWNRFGRLFAADARRRRASRMRGFRQWKWHLDEAHVKINGEMHYLWRGEAVIDPRISTFRCQQRQWSKQIAAVTGNLRRGGKEPCNGARGAGPLFPCCALAFWERLIRFICLPSCGDLAENLFLRLRPSGLLSLRQTAQICSCDCDDPGWKRPFSRRSRS